MRYAISLTGILYGVLKGELDLAQVDAVIVGGAVEYACGDWGIPIEATWFGGKEQKSHYFGKGEKGHPKREDFTSERLWDNWVKVRNFLCELRSRGRVTRSPGNYWEYAKELIKGGHEVWLEHRWLKSLEDLP